MKSTILALATLGAATARDDAVLGTANVHNFAFLEATRVLPSLSADNRTMCLDDDNATITEMACPADYPNPCDYHYTSDGYEWIARNVSDAIGQLPNGSNGRVDRNREAPSIIIHSRV